MKTTLMTVALASALQLGWCLPVQAQGNNATLTQNGQSNTASINQEQNVNAVIVAVQSGNDNQSLVTQLNVHDNALSAGQVGDRNFVRFDQDGVSGGNTLISQYGNDNLAGGAQANDVNPDALEIFQEGDRNTGVIVQVDSADTNGMFLQQYGMDNLGIVINQGMRNSSFVTQVGDGNFAQVVKLFNFNDSGIVQTGNQNEANIFQNGLAMASAVPNIASIVQEGDRNISSITQSGSGNQGFVTQR